MQNLKNDTFQRGLNILHQKNTIIMIYYGITIFMLLKIRIMIGHHLTKKGKIISGFNRFSKFLVLGNNTKG